MVKHFEGLGHAHYLTFSCYKRLWLFKDGNLCQLFVEHLQRASERHSFKLWAFVIMPSHVHILIRPHEGSPLSTILHSVKRTFSYHALEYLRADKPAVTANLIEGESAGKPAYRFWQHGGGYDRNIVNEKSLRRAIDYIHNNPVRAGLVREPTEWRWSSARFWILGDMNPLQMDAIEVF
jgi:putative transposase